MLFRLFLLLPHLLVRQAHELLSGVVRADVNTNTTIVYV